MGLEINNSKNKHAMGDWPVRLVNVLERSGQSPIACLFVEIINF